MKYIQKPTVIQAAGNPPKQIEEFIGRVHCNGCRSEKQCFFCKSHCKMANCAAQKGTYFCGECPSSSERRNHEASSHEASYEAAVTHPPLLKVLFSASFFHNP